jgi:hypothetical protein
MKVKSWIISLVKKETKEPGTGIKPSGVAVTFVPSDWLKTHPRNDLEKVNSKKTILI